MKNYHTYFFDLDGTLLNGKKLFPEAAECIDVLASRRKKIYYLTNHPIRSREELVTYLNDLGLPTTLSQLITPILAIEEYFSEATQMVSLYVVGSDMLKEEISKSGLHLLHSYQDKPKGQPYVILGMAPNIDYTQLQEAFFLLQQGAKLVLINPDLFCPTPNGMLLDTGSIARVFMGGPSTVSARPDVIGKPSIWMQQVILKKMGRNCSTSVMIGDSLTSDIAIGQAVGIDTILLCCGVTSKEDALQMKQPPTHIFDGIGDVLKEIKECQYV